MLSASTHERSPEAKKARISGNQTRLLPNLLIRSPGKTVRPVPHSAIRAQERVGSSVW